MRGIRVISTNTVLAANYHKHNSDEFQTIHLTPWDLQLLLVDPIQKGLLFQKPPKATPSLSQPNEIENSLIPHLKSSLSRTLDFFPPLAGRLASIEHANDNTTSFLIDCNNAGALFVYAKADEVSISDIVDPLCHPRIIHSFFTLNGVRNFQGTTKPLLGVQVTELIDGVFIGCTINHTVVDGSSFWHFFNSWSEISRGFDNITKPPVLHRWFPEGTQFPIRIPFSDANHNVDNTKFSTPKQSMGERVFHFSKEYVKKLKSKANAEIGTDKISSLQAVLAHLWRSIIRYDRHLDCNKHNSNYRLLIGARSRLNPPLPETYFGNAVQAGTVTVKVKDLLGLGLGYVAWEMNKMVALFNEEKLIKNFLVGWVEKPKLLTEDNMAANAFVTSSSPRFDVYGNDFGWGKPICVRSGAGNKSHGKITVFRGVEDGSIDIEVCLLPETLDAMANDLELMKFVSE
ncbi:uncharacterized acetyltransferase At3g50280 [Ziziphus jujuba]|uniref:Uncharacterized acetyltransferase At3g50280 n=2 Tax=Ziziphus jujuba TaxID=326968 RepID=A0ABM3IU75_ZIZJJ|nr:uncharacterized acetyltransferase At3g50280 [Ziziphus jujuba]KAH7520210.1 hypothetical protein FEM48_Zijuj08G0120100 [Ziziphus jujuba var. spinosa]